MVRSNKSKEKQSTRQSISTSSEIDDEFSSAVRYSDDDYDDDDDDDERSKEATVGLRGKHLKTETKKDLFFLVEGNGGIANFNFEGEKHQALFKHCIGKEDKFGSRDSKTRKKVQDLLNKWQRHKKTNSEVARSLGIRYQRTADQAERNKYNLQQKVNNNTMSAIFSSKVPAEYTSNGEFFAALLDCW